MNSLVIRFCPLFTAGVGGLLATLACASTPSGGAASPRASAAETAKKANDNRPPQESAAAASNEAQEAQAASGELAISPSTDAPPPVSKSAAVAPGAGYTATLSPLPSGTRVLHIGDSFAGALGYELNKELEKHGVQGTLKYEKSTYIPTWAWSKELSSYFWKYKPDLVLITLGGNELQIPDPSARAKTVRRLVSRLGDRPCVWIGIPLWEGADPALMQVIRENVAPCLYLDSAALLPDLARAGDGIHPSTRGRSQWAQAVVEWLQHRAEPGPVWKWRAAAKNL